MQLLFFRIPEFRIYEFIKLTEMIDISIILSYKEESLFSSSIVGYIRLNKNNNIPKDMQVEKLNEKFGNFIKEA